MTLRSKASNSRATVLDLLLEMPVFFKFQIQLRSRSVMEEAHVCVDQSNALFVTCVNDHLVSRRA